jgi:hypothetical protein
MALSTTLRQASLKKPAVLTKLVEDYSKTRIPLNQPEASYKQDDAVRKAADRHKIFKWIPKGGLCRL